MKYLESFYTYQELNEASMSKKNPFKFNFMVRFHLGKEKDKLTGESNFMKWRIQDMSKPVNKNPKSDADRNPIFLDTKSVQLKLEGCFLRNRKGSADKIFKGGNKSVVAWVECVSWSKTDGMGSKPNLTGIEYNPRISPNWRIGADNADYKSFKELVTWNNKIFIKHK